MGYKRLLSWRHILKYRFFKGFVIFWNVWDRLVDCFVNDKSANELTFQTMYKPTLAHMNSSMPELALMNGHMKHAYELNVGHGLFRWSSIPCQARAAILSFHDPS